MKDVKGLEVVFTVPWTSKFVFWINTCVLVPMSDLRKMRGNITQTLGLNAVLDTGILIAYGAMWVPYVLLGRE